MSDSREYDNEDLDSEIELSGKKHEQPAEDKNGNKIFAYMNEASAKFIYDYSLSDTSQELAGVLLGSYEEKDGHYRIFVKAAIEARYTEAAKGSVTFTHNTWDYINKVKDEKYPDYTIVGWFHTHPGFGIFLSGYDKFIHQYFFNLLWQVAYVVDPLAGQHGYFGWHSGSIVKIPFETETTIQPKPPVPPTMPLDTEKKKPKALSNVVSAAAIAALLLISGYLFITNQEANKRIDELEAALAVSQDKVSKEQESVMFAEEEITYMQDEVDKLEEELEQAEATDTYLVYTVGDGDRLSTISEKYLDDAELYPVLASLNNIDNPDLIKPGQKLLIPEKLVDIDR